jgi:hypothetical protein
MIVKIVIKFKKSIVNLIPSIGSKMGESEVEKEEEIRIDWNEGKGNKVEESLRQMLSDNKTLLKEIKEFVKEERGRNYN